MLKPSEQADILCCYIVWRESSGRWFKSAVQHFNRLVFVHSSATDVTINTCQGYLLLWYGKCQIQFPANIFSHTLIPCSLLPNCFPLPPVTPNFIVDISPLITILHAASYILVNLRTHGLVQLLQTRGPQCSVINTRATFMMVPLPNLNSVNNFYAVLGPNCQI